VNTKVMRPDLSDDPRKQPSKPLNRRAGSADR
jgi:hypothetical protein